MAPIKANVSLSAYLLHISCKFACLSKSSISIYTVLTAILHYSTFYFTCTKYEQN